VTACGRVETLAIGLVPRTASEGEDASGASARSRSGGRARERSERPQPQRRPRRARPGALINKEPDSAVPASGHVPWRADHGHHAQQLDGGGLAAGCCWPVRTLTGCLIRALVVVVPASRCDMCCLSFVKPRRA
jgi:hypothetical protein